MILYDDDENSLNNQDNYNSFSDGCNLDSDRPLSEYLFTLDQKESNNALAEILSANDLQEEEGTLEEAVQRIMQNNSTSTYPKTNSILRNFICLIVSGV